LPRYAFVAPEASQYRIRSEPDDAYCSTIEALMHVLGALEGEPARFRAMLEPFRAMVDTQLARQATEPNPRRKAPRPPRRPGDRLPTAIVERWDDLVCVAAEANAWPYRDAAEHRPDHRPDELIAWVAYRPATGERVVALQILRDVMRAEGHLSPPTITAVADGLGVPRSQVEGVVGFYAFFATSSRGRYRVLVQRQHHGRDAGSGELRRRMLDAFPSSSARSAATTSVSVDLTSCTGLCDQGPAHAGQRPTHRAPDAGSHRRDLLAHPRRFTPVRSVAGQPVHHRHPRRAARSPARPR
jgi:NADH:ubiquinone oxidoreductase subunit E